MNRVSEIRRRAIGDLKDVGIDSAPLDVDLLMEAAFDLGKLDIILQPDAEVSPEQGAVFDKLLFRRMSREPISQILERKSFWRHSFKVNRHCLTPRPDSETLIEAALKSISHKNEKLRILDLGTGSGCLILSLMSELPNSTGVGVDISQKALAVATINAQSLGLMGRCEFMVSDWAEQLPPDEKFDIILCNPPYIADSEKAGLDIDVRDYEPHIALFADDGGYEEYSKLAKIIPDLATIGTEVFLEVGHTQGSRVSEIFGKTKAKNKRIIKDLARRDRCIAFNF